MHDRDRGKLPLVMTSQDEFYETKGQMYRQRRKERKKAREGGGKRRRWKQYIYQ
jgi:hypothetical protein